MKTYNFKNLEYDPKKKKVNENSSIKRPYFISLNLYTPN